MAGAVIVSAAMTVAGCGAEIPTELAKAPAAGADGEIGQVMVRDLFVLGGEPGAALPAGGAAPVYFSLVNQPRAVETANESGTVQEPAGDDTLVSVSSPAARSGRILGPAVEAPVSRYIQVGPSARVVLEPLTKPLNSGDYVKVTLRFKTNGSGTFDVPVMPRDTYWKTYSPAPDAGRQARS